MMDWPARRKSAADTCRTRCRRTLGLALMWAQCLPPWRSLQIPKHPMLGASFRGQASGPNPRAIAKPSSRVVDDQNVRFRSTRRLDEQWSWARDRAHFPRTFPEQIPMIQRPSGTRSATAQLCMTSPALFLASSRARTRRPRRVALGIESDILRGPEHGAQRHVSLLTVHGIEQALDDRGSPELDAMLRRSGKIATTLRRPFHEIDVMIDDHIAGDQDNRIGGVHLRGIGHGLSLQRVHRMRGRSDYALPRSEAKSHPASGGRVVRGFTVRAHGFGRGPPTGFLGSLVVTSKRRVHQ